MRLIDWYLVLTSTLVAGSQGALLVFLWLRRLRRSELNLILDALDGTRDQVDSHSRHTALEHQALTKLIEKANGRLQFLLAKEIAAELGALKTATERHDADVD